MEVKQTHESQFQVKDLGDLHYLLGVTVTQNKEIKSVWLGQPMYISTLLHHFGLQDSKPVATPVSSGLMMKATAQDELVNTRAIASGTAGMALAIPGFSSKKGIAKGRGLIYGGVLILSL
uniref:Reverse transcriptase Ty1/copia-type domain-containing protein n=1 Tax=Amphimedon queenslandica TaxID=400682 RepID=A0A1X7SPT9_AMPQE